MAAQSDGPRKLAAIEQTLAGTFRLYRSTNQGDSFTRISPALSAEGTISAIDNCRDFPDSIWVGTSRGEMWYTANTGADWTDIRAGLPDRSGEDDGGNYD